MALKFETIKSAAFDKMQPNTQRLYSNGLVRISPSGMTMSADYPKQAQRVLDFQVKEDDVWIVTYPKCGTTWTQEMVWLLVNDLDYETAKTVMLPIRVPFLEYTAILSEEEKEVETLKDSLKFAEELPSPRVIKSHLLMDLLPNQLWVKRPKIIIVTRDPKDAAMSFYYHHQLWAGYTGTLDEFLEAYLDDAVIYAPYWGIQDFWDNRDESYMLFNTYEDMKENLPAVIRRTASFLGKCYSDEQVATLADHLSFKNMKQNPAVNYETIVETCAPWKMEKPAFIRKGEVGEGNKEMPKKFIEKFDKLTAERTSGQGYRASMLHM